MGKDFTLKWAKKDLSDYINHLEKVTDHSARHWLNTLQIAQMEESERFNLMPAAIKWETDRGCISEPVEDELYLYYEQLTKGELDSFIDPEERDEVVRDLTECFNKVFPGGLVD